MINPYEVYKSTITYRISYRIFYGICLKSCTFPVNYMGYSRKKWGGGAKYRVAF